MGQPLYIKCLNACSVLQTTNFKNKMPVQKQKYCTISKLKQQQFSWSDLIHKQTNKQRVEEEEEEKNE